MTSAFALSGDDPLLAPDQLSGNVDPAFTAAPPTDPLLLSTLDPSLESTPPIFGPSLTQLGADPNSPAITGTTDPSAFNSHPSTAAPSGTSVLDSFLKLGNLGLGIFNATSNSTAGPGSRAANQVNQSKIVGTAKNPNSIFSAGNGGSLLILVVVVFFALVFWAEWGSGS